MSDKIFFVTGIDTNIGKTFASLLLLLAFRQKRLNAGYMKPVETGVDINEDGSKNYIDGNYIKNIAGLEADPRVITPCAFKAPLSPYAAARFEGKTLCIKDIIFAFYELNKIYEYIIVEGAGGMLVPLKRGHFIIDIAKYIGASVILVTKAGLGMINQTLLNIEYAKCHDIKISGIIINNASDEIDESVSSNKETLSEFTRVPILGDIPYLREKKHLHAPAVLRDMALKYIDIEKILI